MGPQNVTLCCSLAAEPALAPVAMDLRRRGVNVDVVSGVDDEPRELGRVLDESPEETLVVLCQDAAMDRGTVRRVEGVFSARRGPGHRMIVLPLRPSDPSALAREVLARLDGSTALRESASVEGRGGQASSPRPGGAGRGAAAPAGGSSGLLEDLEAMERALASAASVVGRPAPSPGAEGPVAERARGGGGREEAASTARRSGRAGWVWASVGLVSVAAVAILGWWLGRGAAPAGAVTAPPAVAPTAASSSSSSLSPPPEIQEAGARDAPPAPGVASAPPPPERGAPGGDVAPAASGGPQVKKGERDLAFREREELVIARALSKGVVRGINRLIWAKPDPDELAFTQAQERCAALVRGGVGNFRLPRAPEARLLRRARMLPAGVYWTTTPAPSDASRLQALDTAQVPMAQLSRSEGRARAVCVRRHGDSL